MKTFRKPLAFFILGLLCLGAFLAVLFFMKNPAAEGAPETYSYTQIHSPGQEQKELLLARYNSETSVSISSAEFETQAVFWSCTAQKKVFSYALRAEISVVQTMYLCQIDNLYAIYAAQEADFFAPTQKLQNRLLSTWVDLEEPVWVKLGDTHELTCGASFAARSASGKAILVTCTFAPCLSARAV